MMLSLSWCLSIFSTFVFYEILQYYNCPGLSEFLLISLKNIPDQEWWYQKQNPNTGFRTWYVLKHMYRLSFGLLNLPVTNGCYFKPPFLYWQNDLWLSQGETTHFVIWFMTKCKLPGCPSEVSTTVPWWLPLNYLVHSTHNWNH